VDETVRVEVADPPEKRVTLGGLSDAVSPEGVTCVESETVPENWVRLVRLIVEVAVVDCAIVRLVGLLEIVKSAVTTLAVIVVRWVIDPPVPVTLTV